jgi:hypothetical protein
MRARIYDKSSDTCFISEVYAKINMGWYEKQLVLVPSSEGSYMKFFDYLDKTEGPNKSRVLINTITPERPSEWVFMRTESIDRVLPEYKEVLSRCDIKFWEYMGFSWIYEDVKSLVKLLQGEAILVRGSIFENKLVDSRQNGWSYIQEESDVDVLLGQTLGLHDSVIRTISYTSGAYVDNDKSMHVTANMRKVNVIIDSQWCDTVELVFEGVTSLKLSPPADNFGAEIYGVSLFIENGIISFVDAEMNKLDCSECNACISAYSMRWKFLEMP